MLLTSLLLARIQFAFTVAFHIIFPALSIGMALFLAIMEFLWLRTRDQVYLRIYRLWIKVFAIGFGLGVVSGVVLSYQLGTNWSSFSDKISNVIGPIMGFEVLTAFFLEASFLGIMLFGWGRVSEKMHFIATVVVSFGTTLSAFWILAANSWMQTPQGFSIAADGRMFATDWFQVVFNPSFPYRLVHMLLASYLSVSLVIGGTAAYYLWQRRHQVESQKMLRFAAVALCILAPLQILVGDMHGLNTLEHQPAKIAAMEGLWETKKGVPLVVFALPDQEKEENRFEIAIPKLSSLILTHSWNGEVRGLKEWKKEDRPPVFIVFWGFRIMVGLGFMMLLLALCSGISQVRGRLYASRWLQAYWMGMLPAGFVALLAGWFVTETGRQPYTVYGVLRTASSVSPSVNAEQLSWSLACFVVIYISSFFCGIFYMRKVVKHGFADHVSTQIN